MSTNLEGLGTVKYNGFVFTGPFLKSKVNWKPVYDDTNRVIKWWTVEIMLQTYIFTDQAKQLSVDTNMETLRQALSVPGKTLVFQDVGLGHIFTIGPGEVMADCQFGPKPQEVTMETFGGPDEPHHVPHHRQCPRAVLHRHKVPGGQTGRRLMGVAHNGPAGWLVGRAVERHGGDSAGVQP
jgi:hypothetical protein